MPCIKYPFDFIANTDGRLDVLLNGHFTACGESLSRSLIKQVFSDSEIYVDTVATKKVGIRVESGSRVHGELIVHEADDLSPYDYDVPIVYEDESLLIVNKPAGLAVHPGVKTGNKTLVNALYSYLEQFQAEESQRHRPGVVHRLDKDTSGLLVIARNRGVHAALAEQFQERSIERIYDTLVVATPRQKRAVQREDVGIIETQIGRDPHNRIKFAVCTEGGKQAITYWTCLERYQYGARLFIQLKTGRTHQIRVHMEHIGSPVFGDTLYGADRILPDPLQETARAFGRQALHARVLAITHPVTQERLRFEVEPPEDHLEVLEVLKSYE